MDVEDGETYRNTLKYALAIAGSEAVLAARLGVSVAMLKIWLNGIGTIPSAAFLNAIDVIAAATPAEIARCREAMRRTDKPKE